MTETPGSGDLDAAPSMTLRGRLLRDVHLDCLPMAHFDHLAARYAPDDSLAARQALLMSAVRSLLDNGLVVVGGIVGGSDERVEPWDLSSDDAMDRIHDWYVVHHDDNKWVFGIWFAVTDLGSRTAEALEAGESHR